MEGTVIAGGGPSGLSTHDLIFLAQNPDKLAETLKLLTDAHGELDEKIRLAGEADKIVEMRKKAREHSEAAEALHQEAMADRANAATVFQMQTEAAKAAAREERDNATFQAGEIRRAAKEEAASIIDGAQREVRAKISHAEAMANEIKDKIKDMAQSERYLADRIEVCSKREQELTRREDALRQKEVEMERRAHRISAIFRGEAQI